MTIVRVGVSTSSSLVAETPQQGAAWIIERAAAAERAGLDLFSLGDHHLAPKVYYQNTPMLARAMAAFTSAPTGCLFLLPLWNAVLVAEQIGTLASFTDQTFVVQTGLGSHRTAAAMGHDVAHRGRTLEASITSIRALLNGETVTNDELGIEDARIRLVPGQRVEWWIGAGAEAAVRRAARMGDAWYAGPNLTTAQAKTLLDVYLDECARVDTTPKAALRRDVIVLDEHERATSLGDAITVSGYRGFSTEALAYGSPEAVAAKLSPYVEMGFADITCRCMDIAQTDALETIENLAAVRDLLNRS